MTWELFWVDHDKKQAEKVGEWSDEIIEQVAQNIKQHLNDCGLCEHCGSANLVKEFLPDPMKEVLKQYNIDIDEAMRY